MLKLLWDLFCAFAKVGIFGYGGGPSMIPLVQEKVVGANAWLTNCWRRSWAWWRMGVALAEEESGI